MSTEPTKSDRQHSTAASEPTMDYTPMLPEPSSGDETSTYAGKPADDLSEETVDRPAVDIEVEAAERAAALGTDDDVSRYVLRTFHARGGMGEIWLAEDRDIGRPVALKRMRPGHERHRERFLMEAQITGRLEHPGVVPVHELGTDAEGQPFYIMKFVHGKTLKEAIRDYHSATPDSENPREVQFLRLLEIFIDLCNTVAYAHSMGIIHRDLKPDNVMVGAYGETLVLDWGLAKMLGSPELQEGSLSIELRSAMSGSHETEAGTVKGTPSYMAPEVAAGNVAEVDQRSDIYLLGGTLYEILTGHRPRKGHITEVIEQARTRPPVAPRKLKPDIPRALEAICMKALSQTKLMRYQSAKLLAADVQRYLAGEPVSAHREPFVARAWRWARKRKQMLTVAAAVLIVVGVTSFTMAKVNKAGRDREAALADAARQERLNQAQRDLGQFRDLFEQTRYYLASMSPASEGFAEFEYDKGEGTGKLALEIAGQWGGRLDELPLEYERGVVAKEIYDLLLLLADAKGRRPGATDVQDMEGLLERAKSLREPTRGFFRLRSKAARLAGDVEKSTRELAGADDPKTPVTALDYYLLGEQYRAESMSRPGANTRRNQWQPDEKLIAKAMDQYRLAVKSDPKHFWSYWQMGRLYQNLGQAEEAIPALSICVAIKSDSPWGYSARATAYIVLKKIPRSRGRFGERPEAEP